MSPHSAGCLAVASRFTPIPCPAIALRPSGSVAPRTGHRWNHFPNLAPIRYSEESRGPADGRAERTRTMVRRPLPLPLKGPWEPAQESRSVPGPCGFSDDQSLRYLRIGANLAAAVGAAQGVAPMHLSDEVRSMSMAGLSCVTADRWLHSSSSGSRFHDGGPKASTFA